MSLRRSYVAAAETGGQIYVAGGMTGETGRPLATFQRYDPRSDSWTTLPQLPEPVRAGKGAALDGSIYVVGGTTTGGRGGRDLDDPAEVHDGDPVGDVTDDREVVGDEEVGEVELVL